MRFLRNFALIVLITPTFQSLRAQVQTNYQGGSLPSPAVMVGRTIVVSNSDANGNAGSGTYLLISTGSAWTATATYQGGSLPSAAVMAGRTILVTNSNASGNSGSGTYLFKSDGGSWGSGASVSGVSVGGAGTWGSITGTLSSQTDLQTALNGKQSTLTLPLSVSNGGTGTASPGIVAGTNVTVTGTWPNQTVNSSGGATTLSGDVTGASSTTVVGKINGTSLAGLATGILKNTTTTGVPSIAVAADFPTLNQNTTGTASNVTGIVGVTNGGTGTASPGIVAGTNVTVTGTWPNQTINSSGGATTLSGDVTGASSTTVVGKINGTSLAGLATGLLKNTTSTGVPSIAVAGTDYMATTTAVTTTQLPAIAKGRTCEIHIWGSGTSSALTTTTDNEPFSCLNDTSSTFTITAVKCLADNSSTTTTVTPIVQGGSATSILTGALTCGSGTFASGTLNGTPTLAAAASINNQISAGGTAKSVRIIITGTY